MAIFEKRFERKVTLDDTQPIACVIETAQLVDGHTEYVLKLQRGPCADNTWKVLRRYNDFVQLNKSLSPSGISLPLPGKKVIGNMRPDFIAERRQALQEYINIVLMNPILASSLSTKRFVDPDSYSTPFHDQAQQCASLCLRTEGLYVLGQTMGLIGWRLRKHYFKVHAKSQGQSGGKHLTKSGSQSQSKQQQSSNGSSDSGSNQSSGELILAWTEYGPDRYIDDKELHSIFKSLMGLQHPYIEPTPYCTCNENGALTIRKFYQQGTLKDILCMSTPKKPFLNKYGNPKGRTALSLPQVATYGRQILEALRFLHSKGMPFGHLHSGNIVIIDDKVRLLDVENFILGVPAFYRPFFVQHSKIHSAESIDVYCFGHVLFEMSMGYPLQESVARQITDCPEALKNLLEMILSKEAIKTGLPTLDQLAEHRFFQEYSTNLNETLNSHGVDGGNGKPHFKLSMNAKEQIRIAMQKAEQRVKDEQKSVKNQKRLVRVQEMMSSEEEKKKSKHKAKMEHKQAKLRQQNSLQFQNGSGGPNSSLINRTDSVISVNNSHETTPAPSIQSASPLPPPPAPPTNPLGATIGSGLSTSVEETDCERSALLESICKFNRGSLRKVRSND